MYVLIKLIQLFIYSLIINISSISSIRPSSIKIGAIFETNNEHLEDVFKHAIYLNSQIDSGVQLIGLIERISPDDAIQTSSAVCRLVDSQVAVIIGPLTKSNAFIVKSVSNLKNIPHILINWDYTTTKKTFDRPYNEFNYTLSLYPSITTINDAFYDYVIYNQDWKSVTILYDSIENLIKVRNIFYIGSYGDDHLNLYKHPINDDHHINQLFKELGKKRRNNYIVSVNKDRIEMLLEKASQYNLISYYTNYAFTDLDLQLINFTNTKWSSLNISGFRMFDPLDEEIKMLYNVNGWKTGKYDDLQTNLTLEMALIYDAVKLISYSLKHALNTNYQNFNLSTSTCRANETWSSGKALMNFLRKGGIPGITGQVNFDEYGNRFNFTLEIIKKEKAGNFVKIGSWNKTDGIIIHHGIKYEQLKAIDILKTKKLQLIVAESSPYVMKKENYHNLTGEEFDKYQGYCIDLLNQIKENLNISGYKLIVFKGTNYGNQNKNGTWGGMLGELIQKNYDLAITDLTITSDRQTVVDFTNPFMTLGISILYSKPKPPKLNLWAFLDPFSLEVWFYLATAFIAVSFFMYVVSRISPYEWFGSHPCDEDPEEFENKFSLGNCLWFTLGSIMQQGSDIAPKSLSTRALASVWSFFTLIMVSSYTANLAAFLTVSRMDAPINNAEDLSMQTKVAYGCSKGGSTRKFFSQSTYPTYQRMYSVMEHSKNVYTDDNVGGVRRVLKGDYAFLMEDTSILYNINRYCNLTQIGGRLDRKGYGIAMRQGSPFRTIFSTEILRLGETGALARLKNQWFKEYPNKIRALENPEESVCLQQVASPSSALDIASIGGVFIVLFSGLIIGAIFVCLEFIWKAKKISRHERDNSCKMMCREMSNIFKGKSSEIKKIVGKRSPLFSDVTRSISRDTLAKNNRLYDNRTGISSLQNDMEMNKIY